MAGLWGLRDRMMPGGNTGPGPGGLRPGPGGSPKTLPPGGDSRGGQTIEATATGPVYGQALPVIIGTARVKAQTVYRGGTSVGTSEQVIHTSSGTETVKAKWIDKLVLAVCEAPVTSLVRVWNGQVPARPSLTSALWDDLTDAGIITPVVTATASAWSELVGTPCEGMGFSGTAHFRCTKLFVSDQDDSTPDVEVEVKSTLADAASPDGLDTLAADALHFLLTDAKVGLGLSTGIVDVEYGADGTLASGCRRFCQQVQDSTGAAFGLWVSRALLGGSSKLDILDSLLDAIDATLVKVDGIYRVIPLADRAVGTFTPDTSYQTIGNDDFWYESGEHIRVERLNPADRTIWPVEYVSRALEYHTDTVEGFDPALVSEDGPKRAPVVKVDWTIQKAHAEWLAETLALRAQVCRNKYTLRLKPKWGAILVPTDFLSVSESVFGLSDRMMRVTAVEQERDGGVTVEAVEWSSVAATGVARQVAGGLLSTDLVRKIAGTFADTTAAQAAADAAQADATAALADAAAAQTTADGKNKVSYGASPHASPATNDQWFNGDTSTNCPDSNCKGHTLSGQTPRVGAYPHRKTNWPHRYNGSAWVDSTGSQSLVTGDFTSGSVDTVVLAAKSVKTSDYAYTGTIDTSNEVATTGARMRNSDSPGTLPAILCSPPGLKVGSYIVSDAVVASLSALARSGTSVSDVAWYRGNDDSAVNGGAPRLFDPPWCAAGRPTTYAVGDRVAGDPTTAGTYPVNNCRDASAGSAKYVYKCVTPGTSASTGAGPTGTGTGITDGSCVWDYVETVATAERMTVVTHQTLGNVFRFDVTIQPRHVDDNLDAMRYLTLQAANSSVYNFDAGWPNSYWPLPDRTYRYPTTPTNAANAIKLSIVYASVRAWNYGTAPYPFNAYLRIWVRNAYGQSASRDFNFAGATTDPYTGVATDYTGAGGGGSDGGGGGGLCPAPEVGVLMADGSYRPAGLLGVGDRIWTVGEDDGPGEHEVTAVEAGQDSERLALTLDNGSRLIYSPRHPVMTPSGWCAVKNLQARDRVLTIYGERRVVSVLPVASGPVVRIATSGRTYVTEAGLLNHNLKGQ